MVRRDDEFTAYVEARRAHLYRTALLLCGGDGHRADDVVQQALAKLYVVWPRVSRLDRVDAYVRRIVLNAHLDEVRRPWRREQPADATSSGLDHPAPQGLSVEDADALWAALRRIAPGQRRVVVLRHFLGLSVQETAEELGISPGTVKSQTADALSSLRDDLMDGAPR